MSESENLPYNFGGLSEAMSDFDNARVLIWPVPFEKTVSYGVGTKDGPQAIIDASRNMELFDEEVGGETATIGIHTLPAIDADLEADKMMPALHREAERLLKLGKFLCMLGGEHSISAPVIKAHKELYPNLSVLQIDAHAPQSCLDNASCPGVLSCGSGWYSIVVCRRSTSDSFPSNPGVLCQGYRGTH
jgi:agmatinase